MGRYLNLLRETHPGAAPSHGTTGDLSDKNAKRDVRSHMSLLSQPKHCAIRNESPPEVRAASEPAPQCAIDRAPGLWGETEEERGAIVEHDGGIPRAWAEGFSRLHPDRPPGDVPPKRWLAFIDDVGRFLDSPFCAVAAGLGWGPYDLFGCDRDRPFARIDRSGLLWLLDGNKLVELTEQTATIELRTTGNRQRWRRKSALPGRVLAWELTP